LKKAFYDVIMKKMSKNTGLRNLIFGFLAVILTCFSISVFSFPVSAMTDEELAVLVDRANNEKRNILIVSKGGETGTFITINDAVSAAKNRDIILVLPGEYDESVDMTDKELILTGFDKETCIITHDTTNYLTPVINAAAGEISNLTIKGYYNPDTVMDYTNFSQDLKDTDPYAFARFVPGYAIHVDDNHMYNNNLMICGCDILNQQNFCIGVGLRNHYSIAVKDCFVYANGGYGCLFVHDPDRIETGTDMNVMVINSKFSSGYKTVLKLQSVRPENRVNLLFVGNEFIDKVEDTSEYFIVENDEIVGIGEGFLGSGAFYLSENSVFNTPGVLNSSMYDILISFMDSVVSVVRLNVS